MIYFQVSYNTIKMIAQLLRLLVVELRFRKKSNIGQTQPPELFYKIRCSSKFHRIHRKTPVPESKRKVVKTPENTCVRVKVSNLRAEV